MRWGLLLLGSLLMPHSGCLQPGQPVQSADEALVRSLVDALSSKEPGVLKGFVETRFGGTRPAEFWIKRLQSAVDQGAPFKLIKMADTEDKRCRALIEDRTGERLALTVMHDGGTPPKILGLLLGDPESLKSPMPKDYSGWGSLQALATAVRTDTKSPAIALAVAHEGKPVEVVVDGVRKVGAGDKVTADDLWHIGSIGKSMTATLIGRLVEMGKLKWTTTLGEAFPDVTMKSGFKGVTVLQVLRHRGGIPQDMGFSQKRVDDIVGTASTAVSMRANYAKDILGRDPIGGPGEKFRYSNAGYALMGHLAERLMGKPYEQLVDELVFAPLGIRGAVVGDAELPSGQPSGHVLEGDAWKPFNMGGKLGVIIAPAGAISMTIGDLVKFARTHLAGLQGKDGLLKSETVKQLHEAVEEDPGGPGYACGWSVGPLPGTALRHGHNGSNGTFRAEMAVFPETGLVVASIVNCGGESEPSPSLQALMAVARKYAPAKPQ